MKASLLNYMHNLVLMMNDTDFVNSADTRLVLSRIINFTTEPKSVEVRKVRLQGVFQSSFINSLTIFTQCRGSDHSEEY